MAGTHPTGMHSCLFIYLLVAALTSLMMFFLRSSDLAVRLHPAAAKRKSNYIVMSLSYRFSDIQRAIQDLFTRTIKLTFLLLFKNG